MFEWGLGTLAALPELLASHCHEAQNTLASELEDQQADRSRGHITDALHAHDKHVDHDVVCTGPVPATEVVVAAGLRYPNQQQLQASTALFAKSEFASQTHELQEGTSTPVTADNAEW